MLNIININKKNTSFYPYFAFANKETVFVRLLIKYGYSLFVLIFLGYNQLFAHFYQEQSFVLPIKNTGLSAIYDTQPAKTVRFEVLARIEEKRENDEEHLACQDTPDTHSFLYHWFNYLPAHVENDLFSSDSNLALSALQHPPYLLFGVLRL